MARVKNQLTRTYARLVKTVYFIPPQSSHILVCKKQDLTDGKIIEIEVKEDTLLALKLLTRMESFNEITGAEVINECMLG